MNRSEEPGVIARLDAFLDKVERMDLGPLGHLSCGEVTALADLMAIQRGEDEALWVIIHHVADGDDEEYDELREHLDEWPGLAAALHEHVSDGVPIIQLLNEIEQEESS